MNKMDFFRWCYDHHIINIGDIAERFCLSDQTIRNWQKQVAELPRDHEDLAVEYWVVLAIEVFDHYIGDDRSSDCFKAVPNFAPMSFSELKKWQNRHGFKTYKSTADQFKIERQAVHNWHSRHKLPRWLPFACEAINLRKSGKSGKSASQVA